MRGSRRLLWAAQVCHGRLGTKSISQGRLVAGVGMQECKGCWLAHAVQVPRPGRAMQREEEAETSRMSLRRNLESQR